MASLPTAQWYIEASWVVLTSPPLSQTSGGPTQPDRHFTAPAGQDFSAGCMLPPVYVGGSEVPILLCCVWCRSHKVEEIALNPWGEVNWYFIDTREQFRLLGQLHVVTKDEQDESLQQVRGGGQ